MIHSFETKLAFSLGEREDFDLELLYSAIHGCLEVRKTNEAVDKTGIDYIATLRGGATINIDAKAREPGASKYWNHGEPELALEKWSAIPTEQNAGKVGWTLSESTQVDMILYTFDKSDCDQFFLIPFQHLRMAFVKNIPLWQQSYQWKRQRSNGWLSEAMFVPASVVIKAVTQQMYVRIRSP